MDTTNTLTAREVVMVSALRAVVTEAMECAPTPRYSHDSYLPDHFIEAAQVALALYGETVLPIASGSDRATAKRTREISTDDNGAVTLSKARHLVCLEVSFELEALAIVLPGLVPNLDECGTAHFAVRGISGRLLTLSRALLTGLDCKMTATEDIEGLVHVTGFESLEG